MVYVRVSTDKCLNLLLVRLPRALEKRLGRLQNDMENEIEHRRLKEEKALELEKQLAFIRLEIREATAKCETTEKEKRQVRI